MQTDEREAGRQDGAAEDWIEDEDDLDERIRSEGTLIASQEWSGFYAGVVELYAYGGKFHVFAEDGRHVYADVNEALRANGILQETDATRAIWVAPELIAKRSTGE